MAARAADEAVEAVCPKAHRKLEIAVRPIRPRWVSDRLYPFESRWLDTPRGCLHYVDEGQGAPIIFLHGNPSWSFEYRGPIDTLRDRYRCIALDHLGFGLSGRSTDPLDHHPAAHAERFATLLDHLDLAGVVLVVSDWGGPVGLSAARARPERIRGLVVLNSWCWPVSDILRFRLFSATMSSGLARHLVERHNLFVRGLMPLGVGRREVLTREVMAHYAHAQSDAAARAASVALPGYITGASDWLANVWQGRRVFADKPALVLWGLKDPAFRRDQLQVWQAALTNCRTRELRDCGHFVAEEAPDEVGAAIDGHMQRINRGHDPDCLT